MRNSIEQISIDVKNAYERIADHVLKTPLIECKALSELIDGNVYLKLESEQHTGSFKARGSVNKLLKLVEQGSKQQVITASTGNHALGFARALEMTNLKGTIYMPKNASPAKIRALERYPVELKFHGNDCLSTELHAKQEASRLNAIWVSPYNDLDIIAGQGTTALEICEQIDALDSLLVTIGGGGLISGAGSFVKNNFPQAKIIGCEPVNSCEMTLSLKAGAITDMPEELDTLSDGSAGGIEPNSITFPICQEIIDDTILVQENEIANGIKLIAAEMHKMIEGAAGVAVASLIQQAERFKGQTVVVVICGSNISNQTFKEIL